MTITEETIRDTLRFAENLGVTKDSCNFYLIRAIITAAKNIDSVNVDTRALMPIVRRVLDEGIFIDDVQYSLITYGKSKVSIYEKIFNVIQKLHDEKDIILLAGVYSKQFLEHISFTKQSMPDSAVDVVGGLEANKIKKKTDVGGVLMKVFKNGALLSKDFLHTNILLEQARKFLDENDVIFDTSGREMRKVSYMSPWQKNTNDYIEMLKKTALRKSLKIFVC